MTKALPTLLLAILSSHLWADRYLDPATDVTYTEALIVDPQDIDLTDPSNPTYSVDDAKMVVRRITTTARQGQTSWIPLGEFSYRTVHSLKLSIDRGVHGNATASLEFSRTWGAQFRPTVFEYHKAVDTAYVDFYYYPAGNLHYGIAIRYGNTWRGAQNHPMTITHTVDRLNYWREPTATPWASFQANSNKEPFKLLQPGKGTGPYSTNFGGPNSEISGRYATSIGSKNTASADYSYAKGHQSTATGHHSSAQGNNSKALGSYDFAFGYKAEANSEMNREMSYDWSYSALAIGSQSKATGPSAIAIGSDTHALRRSSIAIGQGAKAPNSYAMALGYVSEALGHRSTAIGNYNKATGNGAFAMGFDTDATGKYATSGGANSLASGDYSFALGRNNKATKLSSVALGEFSNATGDISIAIGGRNDSSGTRSTSIGFGNKATAYGAVALGYESKATGTYSIGGGLSALASGDSSLALGKGNRANESFSVALGYNSRANKRGSMALGWQNHANGYHSYALGTHLRTYGRGQTVVGEYNKPVGQGENDDTADGSDYMFIVGNGNGETSRRNALTIQRNGTATLYGDTYLNQKSTDLKPELDSLGGYQSLSKAIHSGTTRFGQSKSLSNYYFHKYQVGGQSSEMILPVGSFIGLSKIKVDFLIHGWGQSRNATYEIDFGVWSKQEKPIILSRSGSMIGSLKPVFRKIGYEYYIAFIYMEGGTWTQRDHSNVSMVYTNVEVDHIPGSRHYDPIGFVEYEQDAFGDIPYEYDRTNQGHGTVIHSVPNTFNAPATFNQDVSINGDLTLGKPAGDISMGEFR